MRNDVLLTNHSSTEVVSSAFAEGSLKDCNPGGFPLSPGFEAIIPSFMTVLGSDDGK